MKKIFTALSGIVLLFACEKEADYNAKFTSIDSNLYTFVKFVNVYPYATPVFSGQTSSAVQLTYNGVQFSALPIGLGGTYPASNGYATVFRESTTADMFVRLALGTPPATVRDSFLFSFKPVMQLRKYYSFFFCDSINRPGTILTTEDDIRLPGGPNLYRIRFANMIPNPPSATPAVDLYSTLSNSVIFSNIRFKQVTQFLELPRNSVSTAFTDTYQIRWAGTTTVIGTLAVQLNNQMSVTLVARGFNGATGTRAPALASYRNQ